MRHQKLKIELARESSGYEIVIGTDLLAGCGKWAQKCLGAGASRVLIVSNPAVYKLYGKQADASLRRAGFAATTFLIKDGERHKSLRTAEEVLRSFSESGLTRTDAVVALGGGIVGDIAGFAAAVYLRGISFLQVPTTLLAMIDSSVGGKTGVNTSFGKNLVGAFHQPRGVLIDIETLRTLESRELSAGFCEMIKHGAISGKDLLTRTATLLEEFPPVDLSQHLKSTKFKRQLAELIASNVEFKAKIVAGDESENADRKDRRSRKILNFGHTFGHALEKVTDYKYFPHGEAVGYGILFAAELSKSLALIDERSVNLLYDVVHRAGALPSLANIDPKEVFEAFRYDKKNVSGELQMILLRGIGKPVILSDRDIPQSSLRKAFKSVMRHG